MSGTEMRASVRLTLEDQLSGGMSRVIEVLDRLGTVTARLAGTFEHLNLGASFVAATPAIEGTEKQLGTLRRELGGVGEAAAKAIGGVARDADSIAVSLDKLHLATPFELAMPAADAFDTKLKTIGEEIHAITAEARVPARMAIPDTLEGVDQRPIRLGEERKGPTLRERWSDFETESSGIGALLGTAALGIPIRSYADYNDLLRQIGVGEKLTGPAVGAEARRLDTKFAEEAERTGQFSRSIAEAYLGFVTAGISPRVADEVIPQHSMAATAYSIAPEQLEGPVLALLQQMKVPESDIGSAIAAMARASKEGRFKIADFAMEFPGVAGSFNAAGIRGRSGADEAFAALETVMRTSSQPAQAAAYFQQAMNTIFSPFAERFFLKKTGIDLDARIREGERHGVNPLDTTLEILRHLTHGLSPAAGRIELGKVLHGQETIQAFSALLQNYDNFRNLQAQLDKVGPGAFMHDFETMMQSPATALRQFDESLTQASRLLGQDFFSIIKMGTPLLEGFGTALRLADDHFPLLTHTAFAAAAALTVLAAAAGAKSLVGPYVGTASRLLVGMMGGPEAAALVGAGLLTADFVNDIRHLAMAAGMQKTPPVKLDLHVSADPGLRVQARPGSGLGDVPLNVGSPLDPHSTLGLNPTIQTLGRE